MAVEPKKRSGKTIPEDVSPALTRLSAEASGAAAEVLSRWTLQDLVREEDEAMERRRGDTMYFI